MVTTHFMDEAGPATVSASFIEDKSYATGSPDDLKDSVRQEDGQEPTMEDAFIALIQRYDRDKGEAA